jgi:uncharacterized damage-inducible protein DinB
MPGDVPAANEKEGLLSMLAQQRDALKVATYGLTEEEVRVAPARSVLTLGGLVKHVASTESGWIDTILQLPRAPFAEAMADYQRNYRLEVGETLRGVIDRYDEVARRTQEVLQGIADLARPVPVPKDVPWYPPDLEAWSVRWVLLHLIEETARHAGHADIIREQIDGAQAMPLMAAAKGWPATDWLQPWRRGSEPPSSS